MVCRASSTPSVWRGSWGASAMDAMLNAIMVAPSLSIFQQLLRGKQWIKRISLCDKFRSAFLAIDNAECRSDLISRLLGPIRGFENGIPGCADIIDDNHPRTAPAVPAFDHSLRAVAFCFLSHDERGKRLS